MGIEGPGSGKGAIPGEAWKDGGESTVRGSCKTSASDLYVSLLQGEPPVTVYRHEVAFAALFTNWFSTSIGR